MFSIDLHCHASLKSFIAKDSTTSVWTNFTVKPKIFFDVLSSQSSLTQLKEGKVRIAVMAMGGLERDILAQGLTRFVAKVSGQYNLAFLNSIIKGNISYFELLQKQKKHLVETEDIKIINHAYEIDLEKEDQQQVIFAIEGGYNFYGDPNSSQEMSEETILGNLIKIKKEKSPRILYITLTHLLQSALCTHAYAMKIIQSNIAFPQGHGLTKIGERFIHEALSDQNGYPILIDIKHMSLQTRKEYYALRRKYFPDIPILATHMGVTGTSYKKLPVTSFEHIVEEQKVWVKYKLKSGIGGTHFNPWSINLYDEEIEEIIRSEGLIGLSLDQRILGYSISRKEYFSPDEFFNHYIHHIDNKPSLSHAGNFIKVPDLIPLKDSEILHLQYLCNNILHIVRIGYEIVGEKVWDHICLGSDNDGMIKTISNCASAARFPQLRKGLQKMLLQMAEMDNIDLTHIKEKVQKIMYDNVYHFLKKYYQ